MIYEIDCEACYFVQPDGQGPVQVWMDWVEKFDGSPNRKMLAAREGNDLVILAQEGKQETVVRRCLSLPAELWHALNTYGGDIVLCGENGTICQYRFTQVRVLELCEAA